MRFDSWRLRGRGGMFWAGLLAAAATAEWGAAAAWGGASRVDDARIAVAAADESDDGGRRYAPDRRVDILHVKIDATPDFDSRTVSGTTTIRFSPIAQPLTSLRLDAVDLDITAVRASAAVADFVSTKKSLTILFADPIQPGTASSVSIDHAAQPTMGLYFRTPDMGYPKSDTQVWSQGEAHEASHWFPCYDYPNERSSTEVICHVPRDMTVLSNGAKMSETIDSKTGLKAVRWVQEKPQVSYLICLVAGYFKKLEDRHGDTPLGFYAPPSLAPYAANSFRGTADVMAFFEREIGAAYPWRKYDQVVIFDPRFGGMENTTLTTLASRTIFSDETENVRTSLPLVAHEMAHQWFGDYITCKDWSHLWLNEGFATYYEHLYEESRFGRDAMLYGLYRDAVNRVIPNRADPRPIVYRGYAKASEQFDWRAYPKGGWVLHMLRCQLGESLYRKCVKEYLERNALTSVVTEDFNRVLEELTGRSFDPFFDQWVYHAGLPDLKVSYRWLPAEKLARVSIEQTQKTSDKILLFQFPVKLRFVVQGRAVDRDVRVAGRKHDFYSPLPAQPSLVRFDPDYSVLARVIFDKPDAMLFAQLADRDDVIGRLLAVEAVGKRKTNQSVQRLKETLREDPFYGVRIAASSALQKIHTDAAFDALVDSLRQDDARVRLQVVRDVGRFYRPESLQSMKNVLSREKNPAIRAEAIRSLGMYSDDSARRLIREHLHSKSFRNELADAAVDAIRRQRDTAFRTDLIRVIGEREESFTSRGLGRALDALARICAGEKDKSAVRRCILPYVRHSKSSVRVAAIGALGQLRDPKAIAVLETLADDEREDAIASAAKAALESLRKDQPLAPAEVAELRKAVAELKRANEKLRKDVDDVKKKMEAQAKAK